LKLESYFVRTELTVTFHALKPVHVSPDTKRLCGKVAVKDIGLPGFNGAAT
jgi:NAD(P)H-hydrate repair Nnr-like enzyme with NAD(P)H-hydrate epimerase domain